MSGDLIVTPRSRMIFVGINNPRGGEAFWPSPPGSAGERLWRFVNAATGWDRETFLSRTHRINLVESGMPTKAAIEARIDAVLHEIGNRRVIFVGEVAATLLGGPREWMQWDENRASIPHTSGMNRFYNSQANRDAVIEFLGDALNDA